MSRTMAPKAGISQSPARVSGRLVQNTHTCSASSSTAEASSKDGTSATPDKDRLSALILPEDGRDGGAGDQAMRELIEQMKAARSAIEARRSELVAERARIDAELSEICLALTQTASCGTKRNPSSFSGRIRSLLREQPGLTVREMAAALNEPRARFTTLGRLVARGHVRAIKEPGEYARYFASDVEAAE